MPDFRSPQVIGITSVAILLSIGGAWALIGRSVAPESPTGLPEELSVESLNERAKKPAWLRDTMRESFTRDDLTDEQRRELRRNMREVWRSAINERVEAYHNAPEAKRDAILDRHIDEFVARAAEWRQRRQELDQRRNGGEEENPPRRTPFASASRQERKELSESRNPDQVARAMIYFNNLRVRAAERGIDLPGPRGGRGGSGGRGGRRP